MTFIDYLESRSPRTPRSGTCVYTGHATLTRVIKEQSPTTLLEIGTAHGMSAGLIAWVSPTTHVHTIDILRPTGVVGNRGKYGPRRFKDAVDLWERLGVLPQITRHIVKSDEEKLELVAGLTFDMAFIDGDHTLKGVTKDFLAVEKCGRVLFHDIDTGEERLKDLDHFATSIGTVALGERFGLWLR